MNIVQRFISLLRSRMRTSTTSPDFIGARYEDLIRQQMGYRIDAIYNTHFRHTDCVMGKLGNME